MATLTFGWRDFRNTQAFYDTTVYSGALIPNPKGITMGNRVIIDDFVLILADTTLGDFVHIGSHTSICGKGKFTMADFSGLSGGVRIYTSNEDYSGGCMTNPTIPAPYRVPKQGDIHIAKHTIIGANSVILPNVNIGEGCAVGANSLVLENMKLEPWTIYFGSPVRKIGPRMSENILRLEQELRQKFYRDGAYVPPAKTQR